MYLIYPNCRIPTLTQMSALGSQINNLVRWTKLCFVKRFSYLNTNDAYFIRRILLEKHLLATSMLLVFSSNTQLVFCRLTCMPLTWKYVTSFKVLFLFTKPRCTCDNIIGANVIFQSASFRISYVKQTNYNCRNKCRSLLNFQQYFKAFTDTNRCLLSHKAYTANHFCTCFRYWLCQYKSSCI